MKKFFLVIDPSKGGKHSVHSHKDTTGVVQYHITDFDKAMTVASEAAAANPKREIYIMTATHLVEAPVPEPEVTEID